MGGGFFNEGRECPQGYQFPPVADGVYGQGAALLGEIGPVIGWPILLGLSLIISNYWAYNAGEWDKAEKPFNKLLIGLFVLIISAVVLGLGNSV